MAKRSTSPTRKPAKKTAGAAKKAPANKASAARGAAKKAAAPARKAAAAGKKAAGKAVAAGKKGAVAAKKAAPVKKAAAKKTAAKKAAPVKKAAPPRKPAAAKPAAAARPARTTGPARRAAAVVKSAARAVAAVVGAPVKAVAAVVAGPVVDSQPDREAPETIETPEAEEDEAHDGASNGVDAWSIGGGEEESEAALEEGGGEDPAALLARIESSYGVTLPERYRRFIESGEYRRYPRIELAGYIRGPYDMDFVDELLPDVAELGQNAGIYDMDDVPWSDDYAGYVPLASLSHPEVDEPKVFLVHQVGGDRHRVLLFDYEGWRLYPLADSFESFLTNLPKATNDIATAFRPGA